MKKHDLIGTHHHVTRSGNEVDTGWEEWTVHLVLDLTTHEDGTSTAVLSGPIPGHGARSSTAREKAIAKWMAHELPPAFTGYGLTGTPAQRVAKRTAKRNTRLGNVAKRK